MPTALSVIARAREPLGVCSIMLEDNDALIGQNHVCISDPVRFIRTI